MTPESKAKVQAAMEVILEVIKTEGMPIPEMLRLMKMAADAKDFNMIPEGMSLASAGLIGSMLGTTMVATLRREEESGGTVSEFAPEWPGKLQ